LSITLTYSRHSFLRPLVQQTVDATIEGLGGTAEIRVKPGHKRRHAAAKCLLRRHPVFPPLPASAVSGPDWFVIPVRNCNQ
jgi:hypothetical protein